MKKSWSNWLLILVASFLLIGYFYSLSSSKKPIQEHSKHRDHPTNEALHNQKPYNEKTYHDLARLDFESGQNAVKKVNQNQSDLDFSNWKENKVVYGNLDSLNRTTFVTAYIDYKNLGHSKGRERQIWQPTGWHQKKIKGNEIYNRGHLLAYTSSFNFDQSGRFKKGELGSIDNPKNLATQSAFSNQKVQTYYERLVRNAQKRKGNQVVYQIVTVFRGDEKMPRGYWLQAKDRQGTLNFNVYIFNVQPSVVFNYQDGRSKSAPSMKVQWQEKSDPFSSH